MKKPLIGITASHDIKARSLCLRTNYADAIREGGGIPVVLPLELTSEEAAQMADTLDGVLFTGGPDIHPFLFGEETLEGCGDVSSVRDGMELAFFPLIKERRKPILGICRGAQLINVALGGNIYQDIPSQFKSEPPIAHNQPFQYTTAAHRVNIVPGTKLEQIVGGKSSIEVNSMHHQAIKDPAPGLTVSGRSQDGLTEAIELKCYPFLIGVQWHPEYLYTHDAHAKNLFRSFVRACEEIIL